MTCGLPLKETVRGVPTRTCKARAKYTIIFQGKEIQVCKFHRQMNGRS